MADLTATLAERGARYGKFEDHAVIAQGLKDQMWATEGWSRLAPDQRQALEVIQDKVARILNGDPDYTDNWHDIAGYARLVEDRLCRSDADADPRRFDPPWTKRAYSFAASSAETLVAALSEDEPTEPGWIDWRGGDCPVFARTRVDFRLRNGMSDSARAGQLLWDHEDSPADVVAYRLSATQD